METKVATIDDKKLEKKEADAMAYAVALVIVDNDTYTKADQFCVALKGLEKEIIEDFADSKKAADLAHKTITAQEKAHLMKVIPPRNLVKQKMSAYQDEQERIRREEEARLQAEADKRAEEQAIADAEAAQKAGDTAEAEAIISAPVVAAPVILARTIPKAATKTQKRWTFRVTNKDLVPRAYLMINDSALLKQAQSTHDSLPVAGVEFFTKDV